MRGVLVFSKEDVLHRRNEANGKTNRERDLNPLPHLIDLLGMRVTTVLRLQFLLVGQSSSDLFQSIFLHGLLGTITRDRGGRSTLQGGSGGTRREAAGGNLQETSEIRKIQPEQYGNSKGEYEKGINGRSPSEFLISILGNTCQTMKDEDQTC